MKIEYIRGYQDVRLATVRAGNSDGPLVVFVHGFSQSHYSFVRQFESTVLNDCDLVSFDLRGHGLSDKPVDRGMYQDSRSWAGDLHAVLDSFPGKRAIVVAWSYAGYIVGDYLANYGADRIAGINLVASAIRKHPDVAHAIGAAFKTHVADLIDDNLVTSLHGVKKLAIDCTYRPLDSGSSAMYEQIACMTPGYVRQAMLAREVTNDEVWRRYIGPVLISHGRYDAVLLPAMAEVSASILGRGDISWYEAGHSPFLEDEGRFNSELRQLVNKAVSDRQV